VKPGVEGKRSGEPEFGLAAALAKITELQQKVANEQKEALIWRELAQGAHNRYKELSKDHQRITEAIAAHKHNGDTNSLLLWKIKNILEDPAKGTP